jgi:hypothetical protein
MSTTIEKQVLINARALIADPAHWTRSFLACNAAGHPVAWYAPTAAKWCAMGAIYRGAYELVGDRDQATSIGTKVAKSFSPLWLCQGLMIMNDARGHAAILARFDGALAAA